MYAINVYNFETPFKEPRNVVVTFQVLNFTLYSNCSKCIALGTLCNGEFKDVMSYEYR